MPTPAPQPHAPRRFGRLAAGAGLSIAALIHAAAALRHPVGSFNDDALFILLAKSLRAGAFVLPDGNPATDPLPGFPALLLLPAWIVEPRWHCLQVLGPLCVAVSIYLAWRIGSRLLPAEWAWVPALGLAFNPVLVGLSGIVIPDFAAMALGLLLIEGLPRATTPRRLAALAAGAALAGLIRPQGILLAACLAAAVWRARGAAAGAAFGTGALLPVGAWLLRNRLLAGSATDYLSNWRSQLFMFWDLGSQARHAAAFSASVFGEGLLGLGWGQAPRAVAGLAVLAACSWGAARILKPREDAAAFVLAAHAVLVLCLHATWPLTEPRYVIPLLPAAWIFLAASLAKLSERGRPLARGLLALILLSVLRHDIAYAAKAISPRAAYQPRTMEWIRRHTPPTARFQSMMSHSLTLLTGRPSSPPRFNLRDGPEWLAAALEDKVEYVLASSELQSGEFSYPQVPFMTEPTLRQWVEDSPFVRRLHGDPGEGTWVVRIAHPSPGRFVEAYRLCRAAERAGAAGEPAAAVQGLVARARRLEPSLVCGVGPR